MKDPLPHWIDEMTHEVIAQLGAASRPGPAAAYRMSAYLTSTPKGLAELLYDAVIHLCERAILALDDQDTDQAAERLRRAGRILRQLHGTIEHASPDADEPVTCPFRRAQNLLVEGEFYCRREAVEEAVSLLKDHRADWSATLREPRSRKPVAGTGRNWLA